MKTFGARLRQARNKKMLTQSQVAQLIGIDYTTISKYENDRSQPDNETVQELASLYDITIDWLFTGGSAGEKLGNNEICIDGEREELTEEEAKHLKDSLEMFRLLQAKRIKEKKNKPT